MEGKRPLAVEIEMRARFDKDVHEQLISRLEREGEDLGCDDKHIYFYVLPDQLLKVTDNTAAGSAKITLKASKIGQGPAFPETEFTIAREDVQAAVSVFNALGFDGEMHEASNQRHNFRFRGVEIAVKWSEAWATTPNSKYCSTTHRARPQRKRPARGSARWPRNWGCG